MITPLCYLCRDQWVIRDLHNRADITVVITQTYSLSNQPELTAPEISAHCLQLFICPSLLSTTKDSALLSGCTSHRSEWEAVNYGDK